MVVTSRTEERTVAMPDRRPDRPGVLLIGMGSAMADTLTQYRPLADHLSGTLERRLRLAGRDTSALGQALERAKAMDPFPEAASAVDVLAQTSSLYGSTE